AEMRPVVPLELRLRRRQRRPLRVVDEIQHEPAAGLRIAQRIEPPQHADALVEYAAAALPVDVFLQIAGQRGDDLHAVAGEKLGETFLAGLFENREIAPIHHFRAEAARLADEVAEMRIELGGAAGYIQRAHDGDAQVVDHRLHRGKVHRLGAVRAGGYVAVHATLVASVAEVDLQDLDPAP